MHRKNSKTPDYSEMTSNSIDNFNTMLEENQYILEKFSRFLDLEISGDLTSEILVKKIKKLKKRDLADHIIALKSCVSKNSDFISDRITDLHLSPRKPRKSFLCENKFDELQYLTRLGLTTSLRSLVFNNRTFWNHGVNHVTKSTSHATKDGGHVIARSLSESSLSHVSNTISNTKERNSVVIVGFKSGSLGRVMEYLSLINISKNLVVHCSELCEISESENTSIEEEGEADSGENIASQNSHPHEDKAPPASYLVTLSNASVAWKAIRSSQFLRRYSKELSRVHVVPDRNPEERRKHEELVSEIRERVQRWGYFRRNSG